MQSKGVVRFFLIIMALVCLYQFVLIFPTRGVENDAVEYAERLSNGNDNLKQELEVKYLDSVSSEKVFSIPFIRDFTYQDLKAAQLGLGLDLKGGMSVVMQVDLKEFLENLSLNSEDQTFTTALDNAEKAMATEQSDFVSLFVKEWQKIANGKKLADIFVLNEKLRENSEGMNNALSAASSDSDVAARLRKEANENVDLTFKLLKQRIDKLGVTQPNISLDEGRDLILVELPGVSNPERARQQLQAAAKLDFWDVYRVSDPGIIAGFQAANEKLKKIQGTATPDTPKEYRIDTTYSVDELGNTDSTQLTIDSVEINNGLAGTQGPLFDLFSPNNGEIGQAPMGLADKNKRKSIDSLLNRADIKSLFPSNLEFRWSKEPFQPYDDPEDGSASQFGDNQYELYAIKTQPGTKSAPLDGQYITDARPSQDPQTGEVVVTLKMNSTGAQKWGKMTTTAANDNNREVAIVLDNEVVSCPRVINPILSGDTQISGNFSVTDARDLSNILQIGKLPVTTDIIQESIVGPYLGEKNINSSANALLFGFTLLIVFMLLYYAGGGIVSIIALLANVFFIFGTLASIGTVLTLPGVAGIILTIGMAVDANVIIYERIREELRAGKTTRAAIRDGFQQSYSAIIDANVTTILTAIVLAYFGLGPIKGFATILIIGVLSSLFTAVLVGRLMIDWWMSKEGRDMTFWTGWSKNVMSNVNVDWMGLRKVGYMISGALILISLGSIFTKGFDLGVDFKGGYSYNVQFEKQVDADAIRTQMNAVFPNASNVVKSVNTENTFNITTTFGINDTDKDAADKVISQLHEGVNALMGGNVSLDAFKKTSSTSPTKITSASKVGPTIADDIQDSSFKSAFFALLLIFLYLAIRFNKWQFSAGAVAALFHDVIITLGMFSLLWGVMPFTMEIDQAFVAAILTVIGYSVNDTVIVFDRIREFINTYTGKSKEDIFNLAINNTLSRTLITSCTTLVVVLTLFIFGGGSIKGFAFALLIGVLVGTYSSIFVASSTVVELVHDIKVKKVKDGKKSGKTFTRARAAE